MVKINPNRNFVFETKIREQNNNVKETKKETKTYEPKAPEPETRPPSDFIEIDDPGTPV